jgi:NAD(P)-dependent dehydrogenase (short-subunit alcohol dehydrogenase family)
MAMPQDPDFTGRGIFVTGGTAGIGRAYARCFAERGGQVAVCGRTEQRARAVSAEIEAGTPGRVIGLAADVRNAGQLADAVAATVAQFGAIDVLVNSAGIAGAFASEDLSEGDWDAIVDTNLKGTFLACQAAARHMLPRRNGSIINISSVAGLGGFPRRAAYGSSKAAVIMLTKVLAVEWADRNVRVNVLAPGVIRTELNEAMIAKGDLDLRAIERRTPLGRRGETTDLFGAGLFLASDASSYITGAVLAVDGGWSAYGYL